MVPSSVIPADIRGNATEWRIAHFDCYFAYCADFYPWCGSDHCWQYYGGSYATDAYYYYAVTGCDYEASRWGLMRACGAHYEGDLSDPAEGAPDRNLGEPPCGAKVANPVNAATGNKYESVLDISVSAPGIPLEFRRAYNSRVIADGPLGYGWTHGFNVSLQVVQTTPFLRVKILDADGRVLYFSQLGQSNRGEIDFYGESGVKDRLRQITSSGQYLLRREKDNLTYKFASNGSLLQISDPNGNTLTFTYTSGLLTQVSNNFGKTLSIQYNNGRISSVTDPKGQSVLLRIHRR